MVFGRTVELPGVGPRAGREVIHWVYDQGYNIVTSGSMLQFRS